MSQITWLTGQRGLALIHAVNGLRKPYLLTLWRGLQIGLAGLALAGAIYVCTRPFSPRFRADMYFGRGFWYLRQEDYDPAIEAFSQAIALRPTHGAALVNRGHAYTALGDDRAALADYDAVIAAYPDVPDTYLDRGRALALRPYYAVVYFERGQVYQTLGEDEHALEDYQQFLTLYGIDDDLVAMVRARIEVLSGAP